MKSFSEYVLNEPYDSKLSKPQLIEGQNKNTGVRMAIKYYPPNIRNRFTPDAISLSLAMYANLHHRNLIHYHETVQNAEGVFLIMNWCKGKSLYDLRKDFKVLPEKLMVKYVNDILNGLQYLQQQGVIHSNLRASNILLSENETKLTDFGFSAIVSNLTINEHPYWCAPEALRSTIFSKESDIWSLGCTIIEMMTGLPPWGDLPPEEARARILTETPMIPQKVSTHLSDFLHMCFIQDPAKRPTAKDLQQMFWITTNIDVSGNSNNNSTSSLGSTHLTLTSPSLEIVAKTNNKVNFIDIDKIFDDEEEEEEEDDDDFHNLPKFSQSQAVIQLPSNNSKSQTLSLQLKPLNQITNTKLPIDLISDSDSFGSNDLSNDSDFSDMPKFNNKTAPTLQINLPTRTNSNNSKNDKTNKANTITGAKLGPVLMQSLLPDDIKTNELKKGISDDFELSDDFQDLNEIQKKKSTKAKKEKEKDKKKGGNKNPLCFSGSSKKGKSHKKMKNLLNSKNENNVIRNPLFSDSIVTPSLISSISSEPPPLLTLPGDHNDNNKLNPRLDLNMINNNKSNQNNLNLNLVNNNNNNSNNNSNAIKNNNEDGLNLELFNKLNNTFSFLNNNNKESRDSTISSIRSGISRADSTFSLNDFVDNTDSDTFELEDTGSDVGAPLRFNLAPLPTIQQPNFDDFEQVTEEEAIIFAKKDKLDSLSRDIVSVLRSITTTTNEDTLSSKFDRVIEIIHEDSDVRLILVSQQCVLPIIEILAFASLSDQLEAKLLKVILEMCNDQKDIKENFCLLGGIPPLLDLLIFEENSLEIRTIAISIIDEICSNSFDNAQLLIACNGVTGLVEVLRYDTNTELSNVFAAVKIIHDIFQILKVSQKVDFSRIFMQGDAFKPLQVVLFNVASNKDISKDDNPIVSMICELDNTFAQSDAKVRSALGEPTVMKRIVRTIFYQDKVADMLSTTNLLLLLKCIKLVAADPENRDNLADVGVMGMTCELLKVKLTPDETEELHIHANLIMLLADMCALSNERVCFVAQSRLLPYMKEYLQNESELKLTALSVIMPLYVSVDYDPEIVSTLIEDGLLRLYLDHLSTPYWCVKAISAIQQLFDRNIPKIIEIISSDQSVQKIRDGLLRVNMENAPTLMQKITTMIRISEKLTNQLIKGDFEQVIMAKFKETRSGKRNIGQVSAALLDMLLAAFNKGVENTSFIKTEEVKNAVEHFISSENVKHQILAKQIVDFFK